MAANVSRKKKAAILSTLFYLTEEQRAAILRKPDPQLVRYIRERSLNILQGNVSLTAEQKRKLKRHTSLLRRLASRGSAKRKKKIILQKGVGFLPVLSASILSSFISKLING